MSEFNFLVTLIKEKPICHFPDSIFYVTLELFFLQIFEETKDKTFTIIHKTRKKDNENCTNQVNLYCYLMHFHLLVHFH